eukprot:jgi/Botrbrau1/2112/Bobra.0093s0019.1
MAVGTIPEGTLPNGNMANGALAATVPMESRSLADDPLYAPFTAESFNAADFASRALAGSNASAQAKAEGVQEGVRVLTERLRKEVLSRQPDLMQEVAALKAAETTMQGINLSVESVQSALKRVRAEIMEPYEAVRSRTCQLRNLHTTVGLLRHLIHHVKLAQKLRAQVSGSEAGPMDLAKAARLLTDIEAVAGQADLSGLAVVDEDRPFITAAGVRVREQAQAALQGGMDALSQADVGSALQVFFNLQMLQQAVEGLVDQYIQKLERSLSVALDPRKLGPAAAGQGGLLGTPGGARSSATATPGSSAKLNELVWQKLGGALEEVGGAAVAMWHLQRVLAKKRDPLTHACFQDVLVSAGATLPIQRFWGRVGSLLSEQLAAASTPAKGGFVREALISSFPRLATLLDDLFEKLRQDTDVKGTAPAFDPRHQEAVLAAAVSFQNAYLAAALSRMSDAVSQAFPGGTRALPSTSDLQRCIGRMHEELKSVGDNSRLAGLIASCVGKAMHMLAEKAELMAAAGPETRTVAGACSAGQQRNITLCGQLQEVHRSVAALLPRLPPQAAATLGPELEAVQNSAGEAVMPLFRSAVEAAEEIILRMHSLDFGQEGEPAIVAASPYMADLNKLLSHLRSEYLSRFNPAISPSTPSFVGGLVQRMASRILVFFVRHASLLRPLSHAGKLQLAKDMAELEVAVGQYLWPLQHLGAPARVLRAFRPFIFLESDALNGSPLLAELPSSVVLHHLYSRAPAALQSPHSRDGFSPAPVLAVAGPAQHGGRGTLHQKGLGRVCYGSPAGPCV